MRCPESGAERPAESLAIASTVDGLVLAAAAGAGGLGPIRRDGGDPAVPLGPATGVTGYRRMAQQGRESTPAPFCLLEALASSSGMAS